MIVKPKYLHADGLIRKKTLLLLYLFCLTVSSLYSQQNNEFDEQGFEMLNKERERNAEEITQINKLLESVGNDQQIGLYNLALIQKKIDSRKSEMTTIDRQIGTLRKQLNEKRQTVGELQMYLDEVKHSYRELINKYYNMQPQKNTWVMYIMASESVMQAYRRMRYVKEILLLLQDQATQIKKMTDKLNVEINEISKKENLLSSNINDKEKEMALLRNDEKSSKTVFFELKQRETELSKRLQEREKAYEALNKKIYDFMRNELMNNQKSGVMEKILNSAKDFEQMKGLLPQPAIGIVVTPFGADKTKSSYKTVKLNANRGIDILTGEKAEVYSVFKGSVKIVTSIQGMLTVVVQHGSYYSVYSSMESAFVKLGDEVVARQKLGTVKHSKDGYIMHFELWKNPENLNSENLTPETLNPEKWLINYSN